MRFEPGRELVAAFGFLTRLPVWWMIADRGPPSLAGAVWAYPVVGAVVGAIGGGIAALALWVGLPALLAAILALTAMVMTTGALHEDGLADTADGFGGGTTRERKLEIMRDSRLGTYGAVALILSILIRCVALAALGEPLLILISLIVASTLSRGFLAPILQWMASARTGGLGAEAAKPGPVRCAISVALAIGATAAFGSIVVMAGVVCAAALAGLCVALLSHRQIGGQTGDVLAAAQQAVECSVLVLLVGFKSASMIVI